MMLIGKEQAAARAWAGLGRSPQDALESSVVLEAWGGLRSRTALALSREPVDFSGREQPRQRFHRALGTVTPFSAREVLGLLTVLLATMIWVAPLSAQLGAGPTGTAWRVALPISLAMQWAIRRRHLSGTAGLGSLREDRALLTVLVLSAVAFPLGLLVAPAVALTAALVFVWVGGLLVVVRGWGIPYAAALLAAALLLQLGLVPVLLDVLLVVLLTAVVLAFAIATTPDSSSSATPWRRALPAGVVGGVTALLIVIDPTVEWSSTRPFPILALVPSFVASVWASRYLNRIWTVLLSALASTSVGERSTRANWTVFAGIVLGALLRLVVGTAVLSVLLYLALQGAAESRSALVQLLVGLGAFGVVNFLAALLESFSRVRSALLVAFAALAAGLLDVSGAIDVGGGSLLVAAVAALAVAVVPVVLLVRQPDRTLATLF